MSFAAFLVYVLLSFFRPIELFAPELGEYRPMLWLWSLAFAFALGRALIRKEMACRPLHLGLLAALCAAVAISQVAAGWAGGAVKALSDFSPSVMLFVLVILNVTSIPRLHATCAVLVISMVLAAGMSINAYHTGTYAPDLVLRQNTGGLDEESERAADVSAKQAATMVPAKDKSGWFLWRIRGMGFLNDPNDFAQAIVMVSPLLWGAWVQGRKLRNLFVVILPGGLLAYALVLTQSRGAIVGVGAMLFFGVRRRLGTTKTTVLLVLLLAVAVIGNMVGGRGFSTQERSAEERIEAWQVGIQLLRARPLTGAGFGNFIDHNYLTAHNSFVLCFAELGLIGYFVWLALIVIAYKGLSLSVEQLPTNSSERKMAALLRSSLVGFLACAWFLSRTYAPGLYFALALCVSTWWIAQRSLPDEPARSGLAVVHWRRDTGVLLVASILAIYGFILVHRLSIG